MTTPAVSPDGRWLAVGGWKFAGIRIWDLRQRRLERILRPKGPAGDLSFFVGFSPDGRWLVSCTSSSGASTGYHFWRVGTWELDFRIDQEHNGSAFYRPAFTSDGRLMALGIAPDQILLADGATGRELARLTTLRPVTPTPIVFSPDGTKLIAKTNQRTVLVWDLRRIRDHLGQLGLDWDAPPYPTAPDSRDALGPLPSPSAVRVIGDVLDPQARRAAEFAEMNRRLAAKPDDAGSPDPSRLALHPAEEVAGKRSPISSIRCGSVRAIPTRPGSWPRRTRKPANWPAACRPSIAYSNGHRRITTARFQRGLVALALAQPALAADDFDRVLAHEPDRDGARYRRAQALSRLGRHREALADLDKLIPKDPNNDALYNLRSAVREALGDRERARADREKSVSLLPKNANGAQQSRLDARNRPRHPARPRACCPVGAASRRTGSRRCSSLSILWAWPCIARGSTPRRSRSWNGVSPRGKEIPTPSTCSSWRWPTTNWDTAGQARGRYDQAVRWLESRRACPIRHNRELGRFPRRSRGTAGRFRRRSARRRLRAAAREAAAVLTSRTLRRPMPWVSRRRFVRSAHIALPGAGSRFTSVLARGGHRVEGDGLARLSDRPTDLRTKFGARCARSFVAIDS